MLNNNVSDDEPDEFANKLRARARARARRKRKKIARRGKTGFSHIVMKKLLRWWAVLLFLLDAGLLFFEASRIGRRPSSVVKSSNPVTGNKPDKVIEKKPPTNLILLYPVMHVVHGVREQTTLVLVPKRICSSSSHMELVGTAAIKNLLPLSTRTCQGLHFLETQALNLCEVVISDEEYWNDEYEDDCDPDPEPESDDDLSCGKAPSCRVIRKESLLAAQKEDLQRVVDLLSLKEHHARTLLIHYQWDVDKVFAILVERGKEKLYAEAGITLEEKVENPSSDASTEFTCEICFEDFPDEQTTLMDCNHRFCNDCWTEYFIVKINDGKSRRVTCMAQKCKVICDEGKIRDLLTAKDPNLAEKFDRFILESYIEDNKRVKWCPSVPHCGNAIRVEVDEYCEVECPCGQQFCFNCLCELHSPCSCVMWDLWLKKCDDEAPTINWLSENKPCPKCNKIAEKDGGCNLVQRIFGQPFCWLCGEATGLEHTWNSISGHTCGRYKESHLKSKDSVEDYQRLTQYYRRYKAHIHSLKIEASESKKKILDKVRSLEAKEFQLKDFSWAMSGFHRLALSRRALACSYPFAYYYFGDLFVNQITKEEREIKQNLFEDQQQQLERNIERLSVFLEEPFANYDEDKLAETRMKIITLSTVTDDLCKNLYGCIDNDLLVPLQQATHTIVRYRSKGVEKASEL